MSDYSKLKSYLNENNGASDSNALNSINNAKDSVLNFFNKNVLRNDLKHSTSDSRSSDDQSDSWFKEAESDPYCPKLSKKQRIIGFMLFIIMGAFCMAMASLYIPVIVVKSRKFVLLFSLGSVFFIARYSH